MSATQFDGLMLIGGRLCAASDGAWLASESPADEQPIGRVASAGAVDVQPAVAAARAAQPGWAALSVWERAAALRRLAAGIRAQGPQILQVEARDTGNTISKLSRRHPDRFGLSRILRRARLRAQG